MPKFRFALLLAALFLVFGVAKADSIGDGRVGVQPAPPGDPPPSCSALQLSADDSGAIFGSCTVTGELATSFTIAVPDSESNGGLQVFSSLTSNVTGSLPSWIPPGSPLYDFLAQFNWMESCGTGSVDGISVDECTLTAPQAPTSGPGLALLDALTNAGIINDGDCDADDFVFGVPVGCDLNLSTASDTPNQLFDPSASLDLSTNGGALDAFSATPEPGTLILLLGGLGTLPLLQRRRQRSR
jgi:hypothetical protein